MTAHQAFYGVTPVCRTLGVSPSGFYAWRKRSLSPRARADVELSAEIQAIHRESRGTYGAPRIHAELAARGGRLGRKRVARLMRRAGLQGVGTTASTLHSALLDLACNGESLGEAGLHLVANVAEQISARTTAARGIDPARYTIMLREQGGAA